MSFVVKNGIEIYSKYILEYGIKLEVLLKKNLT